MSNEHELSTDGGEDWDPEPAQLRDGETPDIDTHASRMVEQLEVSENDPVLVCERDGCSVRTEPEQPPGEDCSHPDGHEWRVTSR